MTVSTVCGEITIYIKENTFKLYLYSTLKNKQADRCSRGYCRQSDFNRYPYVRIPESVLLNIVNKGQEMKAEEKGRGNESREQRPKQDGFRWL